MILQLPLDEYEYEEENVLIEDILSVKWTGKHIDLITHVSSIWEIESYRIN